MVNYISINIGKLDSTNSIYFRVLPTSETIGVSTKEHLAFCETYQKEAIFEFLEKQMREMFTQIEEIKPISKEGVDMLVVRTSEKHDTGTLLSVLTKKIINAQMCPPFLVGMY